MLRLNEAITTVLGSSFLGTGSLLIPPPFDIGISTRCNLRPEKERERLKKNYWSKSQTLRDESHTSRGHILFPDKVGTRTRKCILIAGQHPTTTQNTLGQQLTLKASSLPAQSAAGYNSAGSTHFHKKCFERADFFLLIFRHNFRLSGWNETKFRN